MVGELLAGGCHAAEEEGAEGKKSIAEIVLCDVQGTSAEKLVMFEKRQGPVSV